MRAPRRGGRNTSGAARFDVLLMPDSYVPAMETQRGAWTAGTPADDVRDIARLACGIARRSSDPTILADAQRITRLARDLEYDM